MRKAIRGMNNFNHNPKPKEQSVEDILQYNRKKLDRQQLIFTCVFVFVIFIGLLFMARRTVYTYYDGYIQLDQARIRAIDDMFVIDIYRQTGDSVHQGDTLFSYVLIDNVLRQNDVTQTPVIVTDLNKMKAQAELARHEIPVLQTRISELKRQIAAQRNDVYYGLADNHRLMLLEGELRETEARLKELYSRISVYGNLAGQASAAIRHAGIGTGYMPYAPSGYAYTSSVRKYCCAPSDGIVTNVSVPEQSIVFREEEVVSMQPSDYMACNLCVNAYVTSDNVKYLSQRPYVEVIVNDDYTLRAKMTLIGLRVEQMPKHLISNFSHDIDAVMATFKFLPGQRVPSWVLSDHLPVRVRANRFLSPDTLQRDKVLEIRTTGVVHVDSMYKEGVRNKRDNIIKSISDDDNSSKKQK